LTFKQAKRGVIDRWESTYLTSLLHRNHGNVSESAREAGMIRSALQRLMRKHGIKSASFRAPKEPKTPKKHLIPGEPWYCKGLGCGQLNSAWAKECGRCKRSQK
jgi:hypothetical protein